jgi:hypothetical protein
MVISTLSAKNQTTLAIELVRSLNLAPGARFKQWVEGNRIVLEPIDDIMTAYGSLKSSAPSASIADETEAAEISIAKDAMKSMRDA